MRKLLITIILSFVTISLLSQTKVYHASLFSCTIFNEKTKSWDKWSDGYFCKVNISVTINKDSMSIYLDNNDKDRFRVYEYVNDSEGVDETNDKWVQTDFYAKDKNNKWMFISIREYESGVRVFMFQYREIGYKYQCNEKIFQSTKERWSISD